MAKLKTEVISGYDMLVYIGPAGAVIPYGVDGEVPATFKEMGLILQDSGLTITKSATATDIIASNRGIARTLMTEGKVTAAATFLQTNDDVLEVWSGRAKNAVTGAFHVDPAFTGPIRSMVVHGFDPEAGKQFRIWLPEVKLTETGDIVVSDNAVVSYPMTFTAYNALIAGENGSMLRWDGEYVPEIPEA